jgi:transcriptional regulator with XRE-family HTH domain
MFDPVVDCDWQNNIRAARNDQAENALEAKLFSRMLRDMEHLKAYLKTHKATALAQAVGISSSYLSDIKKGYRAPSLRVAFAIEDATEGAVPARSWLKQ